MARPIYKNLSVQVLTAIALGATIGALKPAWGESLRPVGEGFIRLIKMVVGPIIFLTVTAGIAGMGDLKKVGRVGGKALLYFEILTTLALLIGLLVANVLRPGDGVRPAGSAAQATTQAAAYVDQAAHKTTAEFVLNIIPESAVGAFAGGDVLQILLVSVLFGLGMAAAGPRVQKLTDGLEMLTAVLFKMVALIMTLAPLGAFGAMAYTVGKYGLHTLVPLAKLMACVYLTMALFIFVVLGIVCRLFGFRLWQYLAYIKEEILLVLGTSSSESALPRMIEKMEKAGCSRAVVGLVIPAGYSFNLDGTSIYLSMAVIFIAQAYGIDLSFGQQAYVMAILLLTSKGAAGVTGSGFVTLAATLAATHVLPVEGVALLLGVDRFMSEARAITNVIGNGVATLCVSRWEGDRPNLNMSVDPDHSDGRGFEVIPTTNPWDGR